ncbi:methyltransferase domain-containing protein [Pelagibacterales bacterium SAG-MED23]|nr:methyltransferase domain-containing protein [Pelagibacterales bacterium SAG-MED23]
MKTENNNIKSKFHLALKYHKENNFLLAEKLYKDILVSFPNHLATIFHLGTLFAQTKKFSKAKGLLLKAYNLKPKDPNININLANLFFEIGDFENALKYFENIINEDKNFALAYFNKGLVLNNLKRYNKANECFKKVIEIEPKNLASFNIIARNLIELGQKNEAFAYLEESLKIDPDNTLSIKILTDLLASFKISNLNPESKKIMKDFFIFLYKKDSINHNELFNNAKSFVLDDEKDEALKKLKIEGSTFIESEIVKKILKEEIFLLILQKSLIRDKNLELFLNKIRKEIISSLNNLSELSNFIISLAEQSFLNEYIYFKTEQENEMVSLLQNIIEKNKNINELQVSILACFIPLSISKIISKKLLNYYSTNELFNDLINMQIREPLKEKELTKTISSIGKISNTVSKKVKKQYEENPYPRWRYFTKGFKSNFLNILNSNIRPNKVISDNTFFKPKVLIAGCGTGQQLENALCYENSNIFAIDLSLSSLAYAKRKMQELNINNIKFMHGDILNLDNINQKFDVIECVGVLHHMNNYRDGLKILIDLLEPHGFLKLGLYSEISRKHIMEARSLINEKFSDEILDIIDCREFIKNNKDNKSFQKLTYNYDFYSRSSIRDLIFHVQEQRFTLNNISKLLKNFNLDFLGFTNEEVKNKYSINYPKDTSNTSIENWNEFEIKNPDIFISMYQFWVRKM